MLPLYAQPRRCVTRLAPTVRGACMTTAYTVHYARVGGISLVEMNLLEKEFLNVIEWRLMVRVVGNAWLTHR